VWHSVSKRGEQRPELALTAEDFPPDGVAAPSVDGLGQGAVQVEYERRERLTVLVLGWIEAQRPDRMRRTEL
jgi:hypothetical protein